MKKAWGGGGVGGAARERIGKQRKKICLGKVGNNDCKEGSSGTADGRGIRNVERVSSADVCASEVFSSSQWIITNNQLISS